MSTQLNKLNNPNPLQINTLNPTQKKMWVMTSTLCRANVQCRSATITGLPIYPLMMRNLIELKDTVPLQFIETVGCARVVLEG